MRALQTGLRAGGDKCLRGHHHGGQPLPRCQHHAGHQHRAEVLRGHKGQPPVEQLGKVGGIVAGQAGIDAGHTGPHAACAGHSQHSGAVAADLHDLKVCDAEIRCLRCCCSGGHQLFRLGVHGGEKLVNVAAVCLRQGAGLRCIDQMVEVVPVALGAGYAARTGVGLLQQAELCQRGHLIAQRRTGQCHVKVVRQQAGADRLTAVGVQGNNGFQYTLLARIHRHAAHLLWFAFGLFSTPYLRVLSLL